MEENKLNTRQIKRKIDKEIAEDRLIEKMNNQFLGNNENKEKKQSDINTNFDDADKTIDYFIEQCRKALKDKELVLDRLRSFATEEGRDHFKRLLNYKATKTVPTTCKANEEKVPETLEDIGFIVCPQKECKEPTPEKKQEILETINSFGTEDGRKKFEKFVNYNSGDSLEEEVCGDKSEKPWSPKDTPTVKSDNKYEYVNHPSHYNNYSIEVIEMMLRIYGPQKTFDFCEMNAFKYRMRMGTKPGNDIQEDLKKEKWYLAKAKEIKEIYKIDDHNLFDKK